MNKRLLGLAAASILALVGTIAILTYVQDADDRAQADVELVEVYVVEDTVEAGTDEAGLRRSIGTELVPAGSVVPGTITDLEQLDGLVAAVDLVPGEQVLTARLIDSAAYDNGRPRLTAVPTGKHEVTVSLDPERVVGGQVVPGDTVAVIGSFDPFKVGAIDVDNTDPADLSDAIAAIAGTNTAETANTTHIMLNKVLVTRMQVEELPKQVEDEDGNPVDSGVLAPTGNLLVTLALDAHEVEQLVFTAEFGRIWLSYESPEAIEDEQEVVTRDNVYGHPHDDDAIPVADEPIDAPAAGGASEVGS